MISSKTNQDRQFHWGRLKFEAKVQTGLHLDLEAVADASSLASQAALPLSSSVAVMCAATLGVLNTKFQTK